MIRPSSLPALAACPMFQSGSSEFAEAGSRRHTALSMAFTSSPDDQSVILEEDEVEGVKWAENYICMKLPLRDYPMHFEKRRKWTMPNFEEMFGTPDVSCGSHLVDLKWRERDYTPQMAAYALMLFEECPEDSGTEITVHVLYAESQRYEVFKITRESAEAIVMPIIERAQDPNRVATPCEYCSMCSLKVTCPARNERAQAVAAGREDWHLEQYHASQITQPEEMAKALALAEDLSRWCDAVKHFALEMWTKQGMQIPGCRLKEVKGRDYLTDLQAAYDASGLPLETFLKCCTVRNSNSKTNPEHIGLHDAYVAAHKGIRTIKATKAELVKKLEPITTHGKSSFTVVTLKNQEEDNA